MPSPRITADEFFAAFQQEWKALCKQEAITSLTPWEGKAAWTTRVQKKGGFFNRVMERLIRPDRELEYRTEWYSVDALYVGGEDIYGEGRSYPSEVHALIEHEFNEDLETEMWKLLHWRAPLKVIISYDWAEDEKTTDARKQYLQSKISKLRSMQSAVNMFYPEADGTEYLFIMATRKSHRDEEMKWVRV